MTSRTTAIVIGVRNAGYSTLLNFTQENWPDTVHIQREELTSGATRHIAPPAKTLGMGQTIFSCKTYFIELNKTLRDDSERSHMIA